MNCSLKDSACCFSNPQSCYLLGALLLLLILLFLLRKRQPKSIVAYKTENGSVTVSRSAVIELVRAACEQVGQVSRPKLKVFTSKGLTNFKIQIQLASGGRLKDIEQTLQSHLRERLSQNLGIENLGTINIIVTSFKSNKGHTVSNVSSAANATPKQPEEPSVEETEAFKPKDESED